MKKTEKLMGRADQALGRLLLRSCAVFSFIGAAASTAFGIIVLIKGHFPGFLILLLGAFFFWLGRRAWSDRATLGEVLNRDFEKTPTSTVDTQIRDNKR